ncbi:MAG: tRNA uridine-5-carboxymethylaminomethyl(34) synthesis GTPase MnmE [Acidobacteriaceae bacterium]
MHTDDTIVAISTPPGRGGIGIVRLSGAQAVAIAEPMLRLRYPLAPAQARFAEILDTDTKERLDEAVVTWFAAPNSYTSEDVVEIAAHGSPVILDYLVRQSLSRGARLAEPGEFTQRAFLSGRMDLTQAEAVRDLIDAQTLHQARVAAQQMDGALARRIRPVKQALVELIAVLEAGIDFAEDDVDVIPNAQILGRIEAVQSPLQALASSFAYGRIVHDGLTLAIVGRPNAGKSSLFNRLVERERAIVTAIPGTTRDLVTERVSLGGIPIELVDTAGLREATEEAESIGIQKSREALAEADVVLLVLDATQPCNTEESQLLASLQHRKAIVVRNKIDLAEANPDIAHASTLMVVPTSAMTGEGISELRNQILTLIQQGSGGSESGMLTNLRQQQAVQAALDGLANATQAVTNRTPHEMLLLDIYSTLRALDSLTGETTADDILNLIFSTFCIGK